MKAVVLYFFLIESSQLCFGQRNNQTMAAKNAFCNVSEKFVYDNFSCFTKSYSRSISTVNLNFVLKEPVDPFLVFMRLDYKYGLIFREILKLPYSVNFCEMPKLRQQNKIISEFAVFVENTAPGLFHDCPYKDIVVNNQTIKVDSLMNYWPSGEYKMKFYATTKSGKPIIELKIVGIINSPIKENFG